VVFTCYCEKYCSSVAALHPDLFSNENFVPLEDYCPAAWDAQKLIASNKEYQVAISMGTPSVIKSMENFFELLCTQTHIQTINTIPKTKLYGIING